MTERTQQAQQGAHTPEPWRVGKVVESHGNAVYLPIFAGKSYVSSVSTYGHKQNGATAHSTGKVWPSETHNRHLTTEEMEANARRIVACVNACQGISTDKLESDHKQGWEPWGYAKHLEAERDRLRASKRRLIAMLKDVSAWLGDYADVRDGDDGAPRPNRAMSLQSEVDALIERDSA